MEGFYLCQQQKSQIVIVRVLTEKLGKVAKEERMVSFPNLQFAFRRLSSPKGSDEHVQEKNAQTIDQKKKGEIRPPLPQQS